MSRKPIQNEEHLQGAFWTSIGYLVAERRAGRHELRVGSQRRVAFEPLEGELASENDAPFDFVEARDRVARALDLISQLDTLERQVLAIMGGYGVGVKRAAKALGLPVKTVLAASRSANRKIDHVAAIVAAGRMCEYRAAAVRALTDGTALEEQAKIARAHLDACSACRREHVLLAREMAGARYKQAASAALLPAPAVMAHAHGWLERLASVLHFRAPGGGGGASAERAGLMLGGGAGAKVAVAAGVGALAVAGAGVSAIHTLTSSPPTHHVVAHTRPHVSSLPASTRITLSYEPGDLTNPATTTAPKATPTKTRTAQQPPHQRAPSRGDRYLELGDSPAPTPTSATAKTASTETAPSEPSTPTSPTGGGSLKYLGR